MTKNLPKTPAERQSEARRRLEQQGGKVIAFKASPATVAYLESNKEHGIGNTINKAVEMLAGSSRKNRIKQ
jgi:hypothetical protein